MLMRLSCRIDELLHAIAFGKTGGRGAAAFDGVEKYFRQSGYRRDAAIGILCVDGIIGRHTNERRVEITMADWLSDKVPGSLDIEAPRRDLRDVWIEAFIGYSQACYEACSKITTLYTGNQVMQLRDGAPRDRAPPAPAPRAALRPRAST